MKVNLSDVIEAIEYGNELLSHYYNKKTEVIIYKEDSSTSSYNAGNMDRIDEFEEWEQELIKGLYDLESNPDDYIELPSKEEIDEYKIMLGFCNSFSDFNIDKDITEEENESKKLHKLKRVIENKGLINDWYDYREATERDIAIEWCSRNNIECIK